MSGLGGTSRNHHRNIDDGDGVHRYSQEEKQKGILFQYDNDDERDKTEIDLMVSSLTHVISASSPLFDDNQMMNMTTTTTSVGSTSSNMTLADWNAIMEADIFGSDFESSFPSNPVISTGVSVGVDGGEQQFMMPRRRNEPSNDANLMMPGFFNDGDNGGSNNNKGGMPGYGVIAPKVATATTINTTTVTAPMVATATTINTTTITSTAPIISTQRYQNTRTYLPRKVKQKKPFEGIRQKPRGRWVAEIKDPTKSGRIWLGTFQTPEAAARVYDEAALIVKLNRARRLTKKVILPACPHQIPNTTGGFMVSGGSGSGKVTLPACPHQIPNTTGGFMASNTTGGFMASGSGSKKVTLPACPHQIPNTTGGFMVSGSGSGKVTLPACPHQIPNTTGGFMVSGSGSQKVTLPACPHQIPNTTSSFMVSSSRSEIVTLPSYPPQIPNTTGGFMVSGSRAENVTLPSYPPQIPNTTGFMVPGSRSENVNLRSYPPRPPRIPNTTGFMVPCSRSTCFPIFQPSLSSSILQPLQLPPPPPPPTLPLPPPIPPLPLPPQTSENFNDYDVYSELLQSYGDFDEPTTLLDHVLNSSSDYNFPPPPSYSSSLISSSMGSFGSPSTTHPQLYQDQQQQHVYRRPSENHVDQSGGASAFSVPPWSYCRRNPSSG